MKDVDLVVSGDPEPCARDFANRKQLGFAVMDKIRGVVRLVVGGNEGERLTIDISRINGRSIDDDLSRRDFTINAVAARWTGDDFKIHDPLHGIDDLNAGILRAVSPDAFTDDPLRIIRSYRFRLAYGLTPDGDMGGLVRAAAPLLRNTAGERISREFFLILSFGHSADAFECMVDNGALEMVFPEVVAGRGVGQNEWHHLDVFEHTLETLRQLETIADSPPEWLRPWARKILGDLEGDVCAGIPGMVALKLAALFHDTGKPSRKATSKSGRVTFYGHEKTSEELARRASLRLRFPSAIADAVALLVRNHLRPFNAISEGRITDRAMYRFTRDLGEWARPALLLAVADAGATAGPAVTGERRKLERKSVVAILKFLEDVETGERSVSSFVDGAELMSRFGLSPGPLIGHLLRSLREAAAVGEINGKKDALALARELLGESGDPKTP